MRINVVKRTHKLIETRDKYGPYTRLIDEYGNVVALADYDHEHRRWRVQVGVDGSLRTAMSGEAEIDLPQLQGISPDGRYLWLVTWTNGHRSMGSVALSDGKAPQSDPTPAAVHRQDWHGVLLDRRNDRVIAGVIDGSTEPHYEFVDPARALQWQRVLQKLDGTWPSIVSSTDDYSRVVILVMAPGGPEYLLVEMASGGIATLGPRYRQLPAVGAVRDIEYPAADGLSIPAYLTLPAGRPAKGLPLVVMPHGGPEARDHGGFDWWAQALAYEGYAVLQPNFRGSTVSDDSLAAGYGEWGRKMQTDLADGVQYLTAQGIVDPARVCIVGASYGGYAAMAGISLQQGIYRCAVSVGGVSDLRSMMNPHSAVRFNANISGRYYERWLGVKDFGDPSIDDRSPLIHADALQSLHKPCELVDLKAEDHWLSRSATRLQMLEATVRFLRAHNPPGTVAN